jgi:tetratricopeptide (TPR) repeat protein
MDKNKVIESATKLIAKGQFDKAVKEYQRVLELDPDDVRVLQKQAELYQKMKKQSEAADYFEKVARTYAAQGFYLKAVALYKQVLKVVERVEVNVKLAELYQQLGLVGDATKEWQTVAAHYEKSGDHKASLDTLKKLVDLDPDNVASRIRLGEQYARNDDLVQAVAELRRAAQYLQRNGRTDDYLRVAERISHLDQADTTLARELAEHFLSKGDSKRALSKLQICFKANPRDLNTLQMLAKAFQDLGQTSKTVSVLKELAHVHADAGRADEARSAYEQAAELAPDDPDVRAGLQSVASVRPAAAAPAPRGAAPIAPPRMAAPAAAPTARHAQPPVASPKTAAAARAPQPASSSSSIAKLLKETDVYIKYGLHDKALEHLRKILETDSDNVEAHERAKSVATATGKTQEAIASLNALVRLYTARRDPRLEKARAELRELQGSAANAAPPIPRAAPVKAAAPEPEIEQELEPIADEPLELDTRDHRARQAAPVEAPILEAEIEPEELPPIEEAQPIEMQPDPFAAAPARAQTPGPGADEFANDLAEADFYIESGLNEEARAILDAVLAADPRHKGAAARLQKIGGAAAVAAPAEQREQDDLAAELASELAAEISAAHLVEDAPLDGDVLDSFQVPAHEVLGEFRDKVAKTVRREDAQTHYDLGIAYKEMGLLEEAIQEFEIVLHHGGGARRADCYTMLGTCEAERGNGEEAVRYLEEGMQLEELSAEARRALAFELGCVLETLGRNDEALEQYQSVAAEERGFRDVAARIQRLGGGVSAKPRAPVKPAARPAAHAVSAAAEQKQPPTAATRNRKIGFV